MPSREVSIGYKFTGDASGFQRAVTQLGGSVNTLSTGVKTLLAGFSATAAITAYTKVMNSAEGSADRLERQIGTLRGGMQGFLNTIATGSWESLIGNITNTAKATEGLVKALDDLEDAKARNALSKGDLEIRLSSLKLSAAEETDPAKKKAIIDDAIYTQKQITAIVVSELDAKNKANEEYYKKIFGHDEAYWEFVKNNIVTVAKNYDALFGQREAYEIRLSELAYRKQIQNGVLTKEQEKERHQLQMTVYLLEDYDKIQNELSKKGQFNEYLMGLGAVRQAAADGEAELLRMTKQVTSLGKEMAKVDFDKVKPGNKLALPVFGKGNITGKLATRNPNAPLVEDAIEKNADRTTKALEKQQKAVDILADGFQNLFRGGSEGFKNMADSIISSIQRIAAEMVAKQLTNMFLSLFSGFNLGGGRGLSGKGAGSLGNLVPANVGNIGGGGQMNIKVTGVIKGRDIALANSRYTTMLSNNT